MRYEYSCGVIPLKKKTGKWFVFFVQLHAGHWGFPKGHPEEGESHIVTAQRELLEETGLTIHKILSETPLDEKYIFSFKGELINKTVHYFIAEVHGEPLIQKEELADGKWVELSDAKDVATFKETKRLCDLLGQVLKSKTGSSRES